MGQQIFTEDLEIAKALLRKDERVTRNYLYRQCYPLFKSIFDHFETDCNSCIEFISEVYVLIMTPSKKTKHCQLDNFRGESTLTSWLKITCLFYCYKKYRSKDKLPMSNLPPLTNTEEDFDSDRTFEKSGSYELDFSNMNRADLETLLNLMPNERYRQLIRLRYIDALSNEETAQALNLSMEVYYNVHKRAKAQYERICQKEDYHG